MNRREITYTLVSMIRIKRNLENWQNKINYKKKIKSTSNSASRDRCKTLPLEGIVSCTSIM